MTKKKKKKKKKNHNGRKKSLKKLKMTSPQEQFQQIEAKDGIRFSWNVFPHTRIEATRMAVPVGCMYSPLKQMIQNYRPVEYKPIFCANKSCGAVLNPYSRVDFMNKIWICPFCQHRNNFPPHYSGISSENRPAEIMPQFTTMEYILDQGPYTQQYQQTQQQPAGTIDSMKPKSPVFIFVVDMCLEAEELSALKEALIQNLMLLPEDSLIGLITYGKNVHVHELAFEECPKSHIIRGSKEITSFSQIASLLGLKSNNNDTNDKNKKRIKQL